MDWKIAITRDVVGHAIVLIALPLSSSLPLVISLLIARTLKHNIPILILFVSTVVCALWYAYYLYQMLFVNFWWYIGICLVGFGFLFVMIPVWIVALILNRHFAKKANIPVTAVSCPNNTPNS
jgi:membrane-bound metal-dependent hydrolase YbcI (DUF457 family)